MSFIYFFYWRCLLRLPIGRPGWLNLEISVACSKRYSAGFRDAEPQRRVLNSRSLGKSIDVQQEGVEPFLWSQWIELVWETVPESCHILWALKVRGTKENPISGSENTSPNCCSRWKVVLEEVRPPFHLMLDKGEECLLSLRRTLLPSCYDGS